MADKMIERRDNLFRILRNRRSKDNNLIKLGQFGYKLLTIRPVIGTIIAPLITIKFGKNKSLVQIQHQTILPIFPRLDDKRGRARYETCNIFVGVAVLVLGFV